VFFDLRPFSCVFERVIFTSEIDEISNLLMNWGNISTDSGIFFFTSMALIPMAFPNERL
jgi:hypothetical protein